MTDMSFVAKNIAFKILLKICLLFAPKLVAHWLSSNGKNYLRTALKAFASQVMIDTAYASYPPSQLKKLIL